MLLLCPPASAAEGGDTTSFALLCLHPIFSQSSVSSLAAALFSSVSFVHTMSPGNNKILKIDAQWNETEYSRLVQIGYAYLSYRFTICSRLLVQDRVGNVIVGHSDRRTKSLRSEAWATSIMACGSIGVQIIPHFLSASCNNFCSM